MIHSEYNEEETDQDLVREYAESLIKEMKDFDETTIGSTMNRQQAIHAASITVQRLAKVTAKKFYYQVTQYLMDK
tara:strand:- start:26 stop:250 length:225 start_codon:yes stop_codon:yes gene_type:complete